MINSIIINQFCHKKQLDLDSEISLRVTWVFDNIKNHFICILTTKIMLFVCIHLIYCGKEFLDVA